MLNDSLFASTLLALAFFALPVRAQIEMSAEAEIRAAFAKWTADFNAGRAEAVCSLFAADLRYDFRGFPERDFSDICGRLHRSLADQSKRYAYALDVREILISGSLAVVRLNWTLSVTLPNGEVVTSVEPGMDVLRKEPDGRWQIIRYIAYAAPAPGAGQGP
jgi:ketosteroid isomerase-like protein